MIKLKIEYMETHSNSSLIKMSSEKEKRQVVNLMQLSGIIVSFPFLRRYTKFLISLPLGKLYHTIFYFWYGYCFKFKFTKIRLRRLHREIPYFAKLFVRMTAKSWNENKQNCFRANRVYIRNIYIVNNSGFLT